MTIDQDLSQIERELEKLTANYVKAMQSGAMTRARTTTYNARCGDLCQRREILRKLKTGRIGKGAKGEHHENEREQ